MPLSSINTRWDCDTFRLSNSCLSPLCTRVPYFLDSFYTNKIAIRLFVVCYPTVTRADRVFNEKKGTPHPPQAVPLPRWGRLFVTQNRFFISPTNPNLMFFDRLSRPEGVSPSGLLLHSMSQTHIHIIFTRDGILRRPSSASEHALLCDVPCLLWQPWR